MSSHIIKDGKKFNMESADRIVITLFDSKSGQLMTFAAHTKHGFDLEQVRVDENSATYMKIGFCPDTMDITEGTA